MVLAEAVRRVPQPRRERLRTLGVTRVLMSAYTVLAQTGNDYVYEGCAREVYRYLDDSGRPSCLVGRVLYGAGLPVPSGDLVSKDIGALVQLGFFEDRGWEVTDRAQRMLVLMQDQQDLGQPWGPIVQRACDLR